MADTKCPFVKYLFDDLLRATTGAYRCLENFETDANFKVGDYPICEKDNHENCSIFLRNKGKVKTLELETC